MKETNLFVVIRRLELLRGSYPIRLMRPTLHLHHNILVVRTGFEPVTLFPYCEF